MGLQHCWSEDTCMHTYPIEYPPGDFQLHFICFSLYRFFFWFFLVICPVGGEMMRGWECLTGNSIGVASYSP